MAQQMSAEDQNRRLKVLSKAQTSLLKAFVHKKILAANELANKAADQLAKHDKKGSADIKKSIAALGLSDLEVDVKSTELMLSEELSKLRSVLEGGGGSGVVAGTNGSSNDAKLKSLEKENEATKQELAKLKLSGNSIVSNESNTNASMALKDQEIIKMKEADASSSKAIADKDKTLDTLTKENAKLKKDFELLSQELKNEKETAQKQIQALEERIETEKEEIMEAMAQEVDEIEKAKADEIDKHLSSSARQLKLCSHLKDAMTRQEKGLANIKGSTSVVLKENKKLIASTQQDLDNMKAQLKSLFSSSLMEGIKGAQNEVVNMRNKYLKEMVERKRLHNMVQELKGNIRVFMRCRPPTTKEYEQFGNDALCVSFPGDGEVRVFNEKNREKQWEFDELFQPDSKQEDVYKEVSGLVTSVLDGYNVCMFAYGQTGSGKTWTMTGPASDRGVNTRALEELFNKANGRSHEWVDQIEVSLLEVYNEVIRDLLVDSGSPDSGMKLEVKMGEYGNHVPGLTKKTVREISEVVSLITQGDSNRSQTATNMNEHSSRSHMMLQVTIISTFKETGVVNRGKLNLVDLAGSERIDKSGATGTALKEAQNINKSLSALGDVIAARAAKQAHIPFRNSTLTFLLQDSLSQDSKTLMIVCVSPVLYNAEETFCSLNFASRVRTVELGKASKTTVTKKK